MTKLWLAATEITERRVPLYHFQLTEKLCRNNISQRATPFPFQCVVPESYPELYLGVGKTTPAEGAGPEGASVDVERSHCVNRALVKFL